MNIFCKTRSIFAHLKKIKCISSFSYKKIAFLPEFTFSTKSDRKTCIYYKKDFANLLNISKGNQNLMEEALEKYPDKFFTCYLLQMIFELKFARKDFVNALITKFLKFELNDPFYLLKLYRGFFGKFFIFFKFFHYINY